MKRIRINEIDKLRLLIDKLRENIIKYLEMCRIIFNNSEVFDE